MPEHTNDNPAKLTRCPLIKAGQCTSQYKDKLPLLSTCPDSRGDYEFLSCRAYQRDVANKGIGVAEAVSDLDELSGLEEEAER